MEDKIYMLSIDNKQRQDEKEVMVMLLPQIYRTLQGRQNNEGDTFNRLIMSA